MTTIYIIEVYTIEPLELPDSVVEVGIWAMHEDAMMVFTDYDRAEEMAKNYEEYDPAVNDRAVVRKTNGHTELTEEHVCIIDGQQVWRIRGVDLWEGPG